MNKSIDAISISIAALLLTPSIFNLYLVVMAAIELEVHDFLRFIDPIALLIGLVQITCFVLYVKTRRSVFFWAVFALCILVFWNFSKNL